MTASPSNKARRGTQLAEVVPVGGTDHMAALRAALVMRPEVIFFLTDADFLDRAGAEAIRREAGKTRILAVEFGIGSSVRGSEPLRQLAESTGGSYKYINVWPLGAGRAVRAEPRAESRGRMWKAESEERRAKLGRENGRADRSSSRSALGTLLSALRPRHFALCTLLSAFRIFAFRFPLRPGEATVARPRGAADFSMDAAPQTRPA